MIPLLIEQYRIRTQSNPRQFILNSLNKLVHAGLYGFTDKNGITRFLYRASSCKWLIFGIVLAVAQSGIHNLAQELLELYLEVIQEDDPVLRNLSIQGMAQFVGILMSQHESERVNHALLHLLQQATTAENVIEEISKFFSKCAEQNENWFIEQVVLKLLDMATFGNYLNSDLKF